MTGWRCEGSRPSGVWAEAEESKSHGTGIEDPWLPVRAGARSFGQSEPVPEHLPVHLAVVLAGELGDELDRSRAFEPRES